MALSAFDDKARPPTGEALEEMLGRTSPLWARLKDDLGAAHGPLAEEWGFAGKAYGWSLRLERAERNLVHMTPCKGHFLASFALGEKAYRAARASKLPAAVLALIEAAPKYAEGRGVRIPVRTKRDVDAVEKLAALKIAR